MQTHCVTEVHQTVLSVYLLLRCPIYKLVRIGFDSVHRLILGSITDVSWNEIFLVFPSDKTTFGIGIRGRRHCYSYSVTCSTVTCLLTFGIWPVKNTCRLPWWPKYLWVFELLDFEHQSMAWLVPCHGRIIRTGVATKQLYRPYLGSSAWHSRSHKTVIRKCGVYDL